MSQTLIDGSKCPDGIPPTLLINLVTGAAAVMDHRQINSTIQPHLRKCIDDFIEAYGAAAAKREKRGTWNGIKDAARSKQAHT